MYKQRNSYNRKKTSNKYTETVCVRCASSFIRMFDEVMCPNCKIQESVDRMTRGIKFQ